MSREMDALVAEKVMGWELKWADRPGYQETWCRPDGSSEYGLLPSHYSTDIAAAWLVEERIEELGLIDEYCTHLNEIANAHWDSGKRHPQRWQLIHATPEDRCKAALKAVDEDV